MYIFKERRLLPRGDFILWPGVVGLRRHHGLRQHAGDGPTLDAVPLSSKRRPEMVCLC